MGTKGAEVGLLPLIEGPLQLARLEVRIPVLLHHVAHRVGLARRKVEGHLFHHRKAGHGFALQHEVVKRDAAALGSGIGRVVPDERFGRWGAGKSVFN